MTFPSTASISEEDYCAIEDALQSSEKGRRFLRAYADRTRSLESRRLLRSISRLHRAALGAPGLNSEICRDLSSVLKNVARHKEAAQACRDNAARLLLVTRGLEETEACLMTLIESIEERNFETLNGNAAVSHAEQGDVQASGRRAQLFGELSAYFSSEPR
jgi:hypothetical protein